MDVPDGGTLEHGRCWEMWELRSEHMGALTPSICWALGFGFYSQ